MNDFEALNAAHFVLGLSAYILLALFSLAALCVALSRVYAFACKVFK